jgi:hypothetical protein
MECESCHEKDVDEQGTCHSCGLMTITSLLQNDHDVSYSKKQNNNTSFSRWVHRMNVTINYSSKDRILYRLQKNTRDMIQGLCLETNVLKTVEDILTKWIDSGQNKHISGNNRKGIIAFIIYQTQCHEISIDAICTTMQIPPKAFFTARKRMFSWNTHVMNGYFNDFFYPVTSTP